MPPVVWKLTRSRLTLIMVLWTVALSIGSLSPLRIKQHLGTESTATDLHVIGTYVFSGHRALHFVLFGVAAVGLSVLSRTCLQRLTSSLALIALGLFLEWLEHLLYLGVFEYADVRDDIYAVLIGFVIGEILHWIRKHFMQRAAMKALAQSSSDQET